MPKVEKRTRGRGIMLAGLKDARENAGLSLRELEAATGRGVYQSTISDLENLRRGAQPRTARKLAEALDVTVKDLRGDG